MFKIGIKTNVLFHVIKGLNYEKYKYFFQNFKSIQILCVFTVYINTAKCNDVY